MDLMEQHKRAANARNLKVSYHGVIVKDYALVYDEYRKEYQAVITFQLPFFDISADDLIKWIFVTFPGLDQYVDSDSEVRLFSIRAKGMTVRVVYLGRDRYTPKCALYDLRIIIVDYSCSFSAWSIGAIQHFLEDVSNNYLVGAKDA